MGGDKTVFVWDVTQGITTRRFGGHGARVNAVDWNADASVVVSGQFFFFFKGGFEKEIDNLRFYGWLIELLRELR